MTSISFNLINRVKYQLCQSQKWQYHLCGDELCARPSNYVLRILQTNGIESFMAELCWFFINPAQMSTAVSRFKQVLRLGTFALNKTKLNCTCSTNISFLKKSSTKILYCNHKKYTISLSKWSKYPNSIREKTKHLELSK